jgi:hypothetical protein
MRLQDIIDELRREYAHVEFLWITAPTERCGITLLQRMFNAGKEAIIYGENTYLLYGLPVRLIGKFGVFESDRVVSKYHSQSQDAAKRFNQSPGIDGTLLSPDYAAYVKQVLGEFYRLCEFFQAESRKRGFGFWGIRAFSD